MNHLLHMRNLARGVAASVALAAVCPAWAGPIEIETPMKGEAVGGTNIACVAQFDSRNRPITRVVFLVDGEPLVQKAYKQAAPQARVAFVWDATGVPAGPHLLTVRAFAGDRMVGEDEVPVVVSNEGADIVKPQVHLFSPKPNSMVSGRQDIAIHANDNDRVTMVSLFIDKQLKLLQNVPPFFYSWDTTQYPNGPHTVEVWAFDPAQNKGESRPIRVFVNNPTGRTDVKDLPDEAVPAEGSSKGKGVAKEVIPAENPDALTEPAPVKASAPKAAAAPAKVKPASKAASRVAAKPQAVKAVSSKNVLPAAGSLPTVPAVKSAPVAKALAKAAPVAPAVKATPKVAETPKATVIAKAPVAPKAPVKVKVPTAPKTVAPASVTKTSGNATKTMLAKAEAPVFTAQKPAETPMGEVQPKMRVTPPVTPAAHKAASTVATAPKVVQPAVQKAAPAPKVAATPAVEPKRPAAPVQLARAETRSTTPQIGNAHSEELAPTAASPAAHRLATARPPLRIMLGDETVEFDVQPVIKSGIAIAPLRQIIEHTGGMVMWLPASRTVQATSGKQSIEVQIGSRRAKVNAQIVLMDRPASLEAGRTMVPVRFLQTALNLKALYDPAKGMVYLYQK